MASKIKDMCQEYSGNYDNLRQFHFKLKKMDLFPPRAGFLNLRLIHMFLGISKKSSRISMIFKVILRFLRIYGLKSQKI